MEKEYIMALDAGTTSVRSILFDREGKIVSAAQKEFGQIYPRPGWVEHDPEEIWQSLTLVIARAMEKAGIDSDRIAAIGITNQRETTVVWDRETGKPVYNAIVWQCRRTSDICGELAPYKEMIHKKTGLIPDPYFSATKIKWILDNVPGAREKAKQGSLMFGTMETWIVYRLTGGKLHITDCSNASRTMLFDINTLKWDGEISEILGVPSLMLPEIVSNSEIYGKTKIPLFKNSVPISGMAGDQQASLFGHLCVEKGEAKNTYGTGCFLLSNTGAEPVFSGKGLVTTVAWNIAGNTSYALEGSVFAGGAAVQWLRDELGIIRCADETEELALRAGECRGCYFVPAFTGLGAPHWDPYARGTITGITRGVNRCHIVRATLDAICYQVDDVLQVMKGESGMTLNLLRADGGASVNNYLLQTQADISEVRVERPAQVEVTALGAAYMAGLAVGFWKDIDEIKGMASAERIFVPEMDDEKRSGLKAGWREAVKRTLSGEGGI